MPPPKPFFDLFDGYEQFILELENASKDAPVDPNDPMLEFFGYICKSSDVVTRSDHPVSHMLINYGQKNETVTYQDSSMSGTQSVQKTLYPDLDPTASPDIFDIDLDLISIFLRPLRLASGYIALVNKAFYNSLPSEQHYFDSQKINDGVQDYNDLYTSNSTVFLAHYYQHYFKITPSSDTIAKYKSLLHSRFYRNEKKTSFWSNSWPDSAMEMFSHFVKLKACGATDEEVLASYQFLIDTEPKIPQAAMDPMTPESWKTYQAWLPAGDLDWDDLGAKKLTYSWFSGGMIPRPDYLGTTYASATGYFVLPDSSCFGGDTKVLLADGVKTKRICDLSVGEEVSVGKPSAGHTKSGTISFISKPPRAGRTLYDLPEFPGIKFTATHPIVCRDESDLSLGFMNASLAASLNPTWQALPRRQLEAGNKYDTLSGDNESLYDLVIETDSANDVVWPTSYVLVSETDKLLEVASEAPIMQWYPLASIFFQSLMDCTRAHQRKTLASAARAMQEDVSVLQTLAAAAKAVWQLQKTGTANPASIKQTINTQTLFDALEESQVQIAALAVERLIGRLHRSINDHIHLAWLNEPSTSSTEPYLVWYSIQMLTPGPTKSYVGVDGLHIEVLQDGNVLVNQPAAAASEGSRFLEVQVAIKLGLSKIEDWNKLTVKVYDKQHKLMYRGKVLLHEDTQSFIALRGPSGEAAVAKVRLRMLDSRVIDKWQQVGQWGFESKALFASQLGKEFHDRVVEGSDDKSDN